MLDGIIFGVIGFIVGAVIMRVGYVLGFADGRKDMKIVGELQIVEDQDDGPYFFLASELSAKDIANDKKYISLEIVHKNLKNAQN